MGIALGHPGRGVPKQALHHVERDALVHQETCKRMAQVDTWRVGNTSLSPAGRRMRSHGWNSPHTGTRDRAG
jgi:hypothetical protein